MIVINIEDLERAIRNRAAHVFPPADEWLMRVAKERMLTLNAADMDENYLVYEQPPEVERDPALPSASEPVMKWGMVVELLQGVKMSYWDHKQECSTNLPPLPRLPDWAEAAQGRGEKLFLFDPVQPQRRRVWKQINALVVWLNSLPRGGREVSELSKLTFDDAFTRASEFAENVGFKFD